MDVGDIVHVVPTKDNSQTLYLKDGRIVTIYVHDGSVTSVSRLPTEEAIQTHIKNQRTAWT